MTIEDQQKPVGDQRHLYLLVTSAWQVWEPRGIRAMKSAWLGGREQRAPRLAGERIPRRPVHRLVPAQVPLSVRGCNRF